MDTIIIPDVWILFLELQLYYRNKINVCKLYRLACNLTISDFCQLPTRETAAMLSWHYDMTP